MRGVYERDTAGWTCFEQKLTAQVYASQDDPLEMFFLYGDFNGRDPIPMMKKARFLDRLHRRVIPFILLSEEHLKYRSARMCRGVYLPPLNMWQEILETGESEHMLLNGVANEFLPFNVFSEAFDPSSIMKWHDDFNFYLYISLVGENP